MEDSVTLGDDGLVYVRYQGDQDYEFVSKLHQEIEKIIKQLRSEQKPVRIFVDLLKLGKTNSDARKIGLTIMKTADYDRVALVGQDVFIKYLTFFMITAAQKENTVKYFSSNDDAKKWLTES